MSSGGQFPMSPDYETSRRPKDAEFAAERIGVRTELRHLRAQKRKYKHAAAISKSIGALADRLERTAGIDAELKQMAPRIRTIVLARNMSLGAEPRGDVAMDRKKKQPEIL